MESKTAGSPHLNPADRRKIDDGSLCIVSLMKV